MGSIELDGFNVEIDDLIKLNNSSEISRLGLTFEQEGNYIWASAKGNVSAYYSILCEISRHLTSGGLTGQVTLSTGETKKLEITSRYARENGKDITKLIFGTIN